LTALFPQTSTRETKSGVKPLHSKNMNLSAIRRLFDYTEWANDLAMDAADQLPDEDLYRDVG